MIFKVFCNLNSFDNAGERVPVSPAVPIWGRHLFYHMKRKCCLGESVHVYPPEGHKETFSTPQQNSPVMNYHRFHCEYNCLLEGGWVLGGGRGPECSLSSVRMWV